MNTPLRRGRFYSESLEDEVWLSGYIEQDGECGSVCIDFEDLPVYMYKDGTLHLEPEKDKEMSEKKLYIVLDVGHVVHFSSFKREEAESWARERTTGYPYPSKHYVAEIYAFYQTREPVQRVELT